MIPENRLSTTNLPSPFLSPDILTVSQLVDYERGGVDLDDGTQGLDVQDWIAYVEDDDIKVGTTLDNGVTIITRPLLTTVSLGFDQNMRATLAYTTDGVAKYRWFDTLTNSTVESTLPDGSIYPRLSTDDRRSMLRGSCDIILAYTRGGDLYYRQQRDRYTIERLLASPAPEGEFRNVGMNTVNRLQFQFIAP